MHGPINIKSCLCIGYICYTYLYNHFFNTFLTNFDSWTQLKAESYFYWSFSFLMQVNGVKYIKYMRTEMYSLEEKIERNLYYNGSWQLSHFIWAVLTDWLLPTHSEHWQHSHSVLLFLAAGQTKHLPSRLSSVSLHSCRWCCLFARDIPCSHGSASMSVDVSTISPSSFKWSYHFSSQRRLIQTSYDSSVAAN